MGWSAIAAAAIGAAATIYASESAKAGRSKAPAPGEVGGGGSKFSLPDVFGGQKEGSTSGGAGPLMGGQKDTRLSQELGSSPSEAPSFGPQGAGAFDTMAQNKKLSDMQRGK